MSWFKDSPEKVVYSWDAVEFEGADGQIQHGIVVEIIKRGILKRHKELLVDQLLGHSAPSQIAVPFHRTLRFKAWTYLTARYPRAASTVQILLQRSRQSSWTWLPGKLVFSDCRSFALVLVEDSRKQCREVVVPAAHVRFHHLGESWKRIDPDKFVKKTVPVPGKFVLDDEFRRRWKKRFPWTKPCTASHSSLSYIQASPKSKDCKLTEITSAMIRDLVAEIRVAKDEAASRGPAKLHTFSGPCIHHVLPKELMIKIFKFLYTAEQAKARCVCKAWKSWLDSPVISKEARFDLCGRNRYSKENECIRKLFAYIHGILAPNCTRIVLTAGNGNVARYLLRWETSFDPCLFDRFMQIIDPQFSCSKMFPVGDTNYPQWNTIYTLKRDGVRWSFELAVIRIFSYHGSSEESLEPTIFPDDFKLRPGLPKALKRITSLGLRQGFAFSVCMSYPTRFVFTAVDRHVQTWDLDKSRSENPVPSQEVRCFEGSDSLVQLKISADGKTLFVASNTAVAILDICEGIPQVKTVLENPSEQTGFSGYCACWRCPMVVSDDGNLCFVSCNGGYVHVWDVRTGQAAARFRTQPTSDNGQRVDRSTSKNISTEHQLGAML